MRNRERICSTTTFCESSIESSSLSIAVRPATANGPVALKWTATTSDTISAFESDTGREGPAPVIAVPPLRPGCPYVGTPARRSDSRSRSIVRRLTSILAASASADTYDGDRRRNSSVMACKRSIRLTIKLCHTLRQMGFLGRALAARLVGRGDEVVILSRSEANTSTEPAPLRGIRNRSDPGRMNSMGLMPSSISPAGELMCAAPSATLTS